MRWSGSPLVALLVALLVVSTLGLGAAVPADRTNQPATRTEHDARTERDALAAGNAALQRADYAAALTFYAQALRHTHDPGQVAFNAAVAHYQLGQFREAELHWQRCLLDDCIPPTRRALALYNLGCALLRQATDTDAVRCREAVQAFRQSLAEGAGTALPEPYASDARYNLELARLLWAKARAKAKGQDAPLPNTTEPGNSPQPPKQPPETTQPPKQPDDRPGQPTPTPPPGQRPTPIAKSTSDGTDPDDTRERPPGFGSLPTLADDDTPQRLSPADTRALLAEAARRISTDRQRQFRPPGGKRDVPFPNW